MNFTLLRREKKYSGTIIDLTVDELEYSSGNRTKREIIEHPGGAVVVGLLDSGDILLIRQYRHPLGESIIELPAGKLERDEDPLLCAQRELREETGYIASAWEPITSIYTTPGFCDEILHIFLARGLSLHSQGQLLEEGESSIEIITMPMSQAIGMIESGEIKDGKTIAGILLGARKAGIA